MEHKGVFSELCIDVGEANNVVDISSLHIKVNGENILLVKSSM